MKALQGYRTAILASLIAIDGAVWVVWGQDIPTKYIPLEHVITALLVFWARIITKTPFGQQLPTLDTYDPTDANFEVPEGDPAPPPPAPGIIGGA